ncbi:MAG: type II toxin-antitoxin system Phd/YefM family antitoxin [Acidobacteria bacterium]|nr:type II toxin-antitoxin system Phd/YefM family antitoxin [Acidobacteriota bacterium]
MTLKISALTARTQFGQIMERAIDRQERFLVDRRGQPAVIIMSVDDYLRTIAPEDKALKASRAQAQRTGLDKLAIKEIDSEIAAYRRGKRAKAPVRR